jgi:glycosyltransferase involved in cell wall biosynthesis
LKTVIVSTEYETGASGGVQSVVAFVVAALQRLNAGDIEVVSLRMSHRAPESRRLLKPLSWRGSLVSTSSVNGVKVHQVGSAWAELESIRFLPRPWLDALLSDADRIVVVAGTPAVFNSVRRAKAPKILQVATMVSFERAAQNSQLRGPIGGYRRVTTWMTGQLDEKALRDAEHVLVENHLMLQECKARGVRKVELCPPGINATQFHPAQIAVSRPYVLMVGRLSDPRKNVAGLIRAYAQARAEHSVVHDLVLAGFSRPSIEDLELIRTLHLEPVVRIVSPVSAGDLVGLYQGADVFASASFEEGLGLTYLEAMSCGVPVVTTDTAGANFVLERSTAGTIVSHGNEFTGRFASELARWCHDVELRTQGGIAARDRVLEEFSEDVTARRFVDAIIRTGPKA